MRSSYLAYSICVLLILCCVPAVSAGEGIMFITQWGSLGSEDGQLRLAEDVAVDSAGNVYVADTFNDRIQKFTSDGTFISEWGSFGSKNGQFEFPKGIAVDGAGNVYVLDSNNHRVQKFTSTGAYITQWDTLRQKETEFQDLYGIAVDSAGNVYVADRGDDLILKYTSTGDFVTQWGGRGDGNGKFGDDVSLGSLWDVAVDDAGNVYASDRSGKRIQKFKSDGTFITQWGSGDDSETGEYGFELPDRIAADGAGNVFVVDSLNNRISKYSTTGAFLAQWGVEGKGAGQFDSPEGLAVDKSGNVYVVDGLNERVQKFGPLGSATPAPTRSSTTRATGSGTAKSGAGSLEDAGYVSSEIWGAFKFEGLENIAVDGAGNIFTSEKWAKRIQSFTPNGNYNALWKIETEGGVNDELSYLNDQLSGPEGIAADSQGNVYVVDGSNNKVKKYAPDGTLDIEWGEYGEGDDQFGNPTEIAVDHAGNVYVADDVMKAGHRIKKFTSDGTFVTQWGASAEAPLSGVTDMATDSAGNVYVVDMIAERVLKFSPTGTLLTSWDGSKSGSADAELSSPHGIAVDSADNVYVTDNQIGFGARIQKFTSTGTRVASWIQEEAGGLYGIAVDTTGNIYVVFSSDRGLRIMKYAPPGSIASSVNGNLATTRSTTSPSGTVRGAVAQGTTAKAAGSSPLEVLGVAIVACAVIAVGRRH